MGAEGRRAGEWALGLRVHELAEEAASRQRLLEVGRALAARDDAGPVILGCAGMAR